MKAFISIVTHELKLLSPTSRSVCYGVIEDCNAWPIQGIDYSLHTNVLVVFNVKKITLRTTCLQRLFTVAAYGLQLLHESKMRTVAAGFFVYSLAQL